MRKLAPFLVSLVLAASLAACSANSNTAAAGLNAAGARAAGFTAVDQYLHDSPDRLAAVTQKLDLADALLLKGASYDDPAALLFTTVDPWRMFYFQLILDTIGPLVGDRGAVIKTGTTAYTLVRVALDGARQALALRSPRPA